MEKINWTITVEEANDGSGDLVLPFPQDFLDTVGWKEGDTLEWEDNGDGSFSLSKINNE
jgi:bifunctional DNA-binding transcriptional regulator/antitoxin component of YhaV-PrlF toxin-antitoxin module